jgi:hypothetical protein
MAFAAAAVPLLLGGAAIASGVQSYRESKYQGEVQAQELKAQAKTEAVAAGQQQIERRRALIRALSSQNAAAGAAGIETSGSVAAIARSDIRDASNDLLYSNLNSDARQRALRSQASNARRIGNTRANMSLLDSAVKIGQAGL